MPALKGITDFRQLPSAFDPHQTEDTRPLAPMTSPDHSKRTAALRPIIEEKTEKVRGRKKINKNYNTSRATKANYQI